MPRVTPEGAGGGPPLELDAAEMARAINRLKRAQGQIAGVVRMLEEGRDCVEVATQLSAVSTAVNRAGFTILTAGLRHCLIASGGRETADVLKVQRLFLSLS